jgi:hypothetical protein
VEHGLAPSAADLAEAVRIGGGDDHRDTDANLTARRPWSLNSAARRRKIMARRGKQLTPAQKQRRQAERDERDRLEAITGITEQLTCLGGLAAQVTRDCEDHVDDLAFDLGTSRLAAEFWADHPAAHDVVAMLADLTAEHQRHCDAITALADRFDTFVHSQANHEHVHLRPIETYRQRVEERLYPPVDPSKPAH